MSVYRTIGLLVSFSHAANSDLKQILKLANLDLNSIRILANSNPILKESLANSDLDLAGPN